MNKELLEAAAGKIQTKLVNEVQSLVDVMNAEIGRTLNSLLQVESLPPENAEDSPQDKKDTTPTP